MSNGDVDFHPIELTAHFLLSGAIDSLQENFELLHQSQKILLTRLNHIDDRLRKLDTQLDEYDFDLSPVYARIKELKKVLKTCELSLRKDNQIVDQIENKLDY